MNTPLRQALLGRGIAPEEAAVLQRLRPPRGHSVTRYAAGLENARFLRFSAAGDLLVSQPRLGIVSLLERDADGDGRADARRILLEGLDRPHGLDFHAGWLYVAESGAIGRIRFDPDTRAVSGSFERVVSGLPSGGNHWTRTIRFGPDGWLYVSIGSSCNACVEQDRRRAAIVRYGPDGSGEEIFATGLRNAVGFDFHPQDGTLYATDNGRDLLGDDFPPCEWNRVEKGGFYGWPFANGDRVADPDLGAGRAAEIARSIPPAHAFRAHNAPLGVTFVRGERAPASLRGSAVVALHGSWTRTRKDGYKVVSLAPAPDGSWVEADFLTGFLRGDDVIGRPVDVAEGPDGAIYVSDDYGGAVFRVSRGPTPGATASATTTPAATPLAGLGAADIAARTQRGRRLYSGSGCAACHDTHAPPPGVVPKPLANLSARYDVDSLARYLAAPTPPMPAYPMSDDERRDLAVFLLTAR